MKPYIKTATADTPSVILDAERGIFEISQMSLPEDAVDFYSPILAWLREYAQNPNPETVFNMKLEYFNTASSKQLIQILLILQEMKDRSNVLVKWFYKEIDEDMLALGEEYKQIMQIPFELTLVP
ncbi:MAG: DUF1987 domain-containing protein [Bacteroidales bacterium]|jgi:hypothetical protein|nr:DUF1987 domain-containing protein [Bacteroidales bacterium]MBO7597436.1 DUF1987 domain-containing protein [Bacteroidales bacterium]MBP5502163.1 DUF1987 domain-containing protein [Bacteroidales bacterium]MBQ1884658.1 DUF1987 domain-containing protein [Bacteroidales bacterium]MBQ3619260.1 DUF1987 domain-containing protein [Bacteroidales bacterium]